VSEELAHHAVEWWPNPTSEAALSLTERAKKHPDLIEEFFSIRKVIDGGVGDVTNAVCERVLPRLANLGERLGRVEQATVTLPRARPAAPRDLKTAFARASVGLLRWPTTVAGDRWLDRPELQALLERVSSARASTTVVLGTPGSGKSALLARLGQELVGRGTTVLAIKADQLRNVVDSAAKLAERLDLPYLTDQAVLSVADSEPVVVLLDQVDALADLADLKSERLHVLLNLVDRLAGHRRVHVVCSCREFEYQHDGRLSRLEAHVVRLQPPPWELVSAVLAAQGVAADAWPDDARSLLQVPHHLALFLNHLRGSGEHLVFTSYQQLFNDVWHEQVVRSGNGRPELLYGLADQLADQEELWIDRGRWENRWPAVEALIAADVLCLTEDGFRVGFRHQSLFEFTRAKAFAREGTSLATYVLARQDALFVRPTLWMALNYLRRASPPVYMREFDALWNRPDLRRHLKHLLIDFLSQVEQPPPADWEQSRMIAAIRDGSWRRKVLTAVTGQAVWFRLLAGSQLSAEMRKPPEEAGDLTWVLVAAFAFERDRCLQLIEDNWLPDESKLPLAWRALTYLEDWSERAVGVATAIVRRTPIEQGGMWHVAQTIAKEAPALAVRLVASWLEATRRRIIVAPGCGEEERERQLRRLLHSHTAWHDIDKLAEQVPSEFALAAWQELLEITRHLRNSRSEYVVRYTDDLLWPARLDLREYVAFDTPDQFLLALDAAVRAFARSRPEAFLAFVQHSGNPDSRLLERLLCRGVRELAPDYPVAAFAFLTADPRRFWLGGMHDDQGDSIELIATLAPHLTDDQLARLTASIRGWQVYRECEGEERDPGRIYARGHRFRLLTALPRERVPEDVRREVEAERAALPGYARAAQSQCGTGVRLIGSPVSHSEMEGRTDSEVASLFDELPDSTESSHPNDCMAGGSVQLSQEFEAFARAHPDRALAVAGRLRPGDQERPAAHAVRGLVAAKRPADEVLALVEALDARGFACPEFRETVAFALDDLARTAGLPERACNLLHRWRLADWPSDDREETGHERDDHARSPTSILWQNDGMVALPRGRFPVLAALSRGYLCREPPATGPWLDMLCDHVQREESAAVWRAMCLYLGDVWWCSDRERAQAFLERLFAGWPAVLTCNLGVRLLARVAQLLPDEIRWRAYDTVRGWDAQRGPQAFGELVGLRHLLHPEDSWACGQVEDSLTASPDAESEWEAVGVAFAAGNLWKEPTARARATELLCRLVPWPSERVGHAVMAVYHTIDELPVDEPGLSLLRQIAAHPDMLVRSGVDESFFDHLLDAFPIDPDLVCQISEEAVRRRGSELESISHGLYLANSALIDISLRLQRSGGHYRRRGLELFEALLDRGVAEAVNLVRGNDLRLAPGGHPFQSRRRKRPRPAGPS
jgi:hypothetical protein